MSKELKAAAQEFEAHVKTAGSDPIERDALSIIGFVEGAMASGQSGVWKFWPTWDTGDEYYVEVDDGEWSVGPVSGQGVRSESGTDVRGLKKWFWNVFNIGQRRGLTWDRER